MSKATTLESREQTMKFPTLDHMKEELSKYKTESSTKGFINDLKRKSDSLVTDLLMKKEIQQEEGWKKITIETHSTGWFYFFDNTEILLEVSISPKGKVKFIGYGEEENG